MRFPWLMLPVLVACNSAPDPIDPALLRPVLQKPVSPEQGAGVPPPVIGVEAAEPEVALPDKQVQPEPSRLEKGIALLRSGDFGAADPVLREELVEGDDFREAAIALAGLYQSREGHVDAEAILLAGLSRDPDDLSMGMFYARVLSETNRWDESAASLRKLVEAHPDHALLLIGLIAAERAINRLDEAAALLDHLLNDLAEDPLVQERRAEFQVLSEDLAEECRQGRRLSQTASELFALLRAGETRAIRLAALETLVARPSTQPRAVLIAYSQKDPILRVRALRSWPEEAEDMQDLPENLLILFSDPDPRVRAEVSALARRLPPDQAAGLILDAMAKETDGYAFRVMHSDMSQILQRKIILSPGAEDDANSRQSTVLQWREAWDH
jgi:tetratricopeptide (TPR) repeat protein